MAAHSQKAAIQQELVATEVWMLATVLMQHLLYQGWPYPPAYLPAMVASMQAEHRQLVLLGEDAL